MEDSTDRVVVTSYREESQVRHSDEKKGFSTYTLVKPLWVHLKKTKTYIK